MEETKDVPQEGDFKIKKKRGRPRKLSNENSVVRLKVEQENKDTNADKESSPVEVSSSESTGSIQEVETTKPEVQQATEESSQVEKIENPISEVIEEEIKETKQELKEAVQESNQTGRQLPENIEKLVTFMEDTGGTVEDYVRLNRDYSSFDDVTLLREYYKNTKPHLDSEEIDFLLNDQFAYDEETEEENIIRKKKLAIKEEVAKAKNFLEDTKSKYYEEIKLRPGVTQEQQKAMEFFNRYNNEQDKLKQTREEFINSTNNFFNDFKGFDFNLGDKKVRYNVNNPQELANSQSDINNFFKMFLDEKGSVKDYNKYHKSLFAAKNIDTIANHFYEQGKADALKQEYAKNKNINTEARFSPNDDSIYINGMKLKAVSGVNSSKLKIKRK
jgi:hypothetical protein